MTKYDDRNDSEWKIMGWDGIQCDGTGRNSIGCYGSNGKEYFVWNRIKE